VFIFISIFCNSSILKEIKNNDNNVIIYNNLNIINLILNKVRLVTDVYDV